MNKWIQRWDRVPLYAIVLLGLVLRVLYAALARPAPLVLDMGEYHEYGVFLARDGAYGSAYRLPGYPLFIAFFYALFGINVRAVLLGQALLGTASVWLTARAGRTLLGEREGKLAAVLVAINPSLLLYTNFYLSENLFTFLMAAFVAALGAYALRPRTLTASTIGLCVAAAMLTRMVGLGLFFVAAAVMAYAAHERGRSAGPAGGGASRRWAVHTVIALLVMSACFAPWLVRNYRWYGAFVVDTTGGRSLLIGHNPGATGKLDFSSGAAFDARFRRLPEVEAQRVARHEAIRYMATHPLHEAKLAARKAAIYLSPAFREYVLAYSSNFFGRLDDFGLSCLLLFGFGAFAALVALSWLAAFRPASATVPLETERPEPPWRAILFGTIAYFVVVHMATFAEGRFHVPQIPLFSLAAAAGLFRAREILGSLRGRRPAAVIFTVGLACLLAGWAIQLYAYLPWIIAIYGPGGHKLYFPFGAL